MSKNLENMPVDELCKGFSDADKGRVQRFADDYAVISLAKFKAEFKGTDVDEEKRTLVTSYIEGCNYA